MDETQRATVKFKLGSIEIEFAGNESFLKAELPDLIKAVFEIYKTNFSQGLPTLPTPEPKFPLSGEPAKKVELTTNSIAAKLGCKSGPELVLAACAFLTLAEGKETFARREIAKAMKSASTFYKKTYRDNLTNSLASLVKDGKLLERSTGIFALHADTKTNMEEKLGG